MKTQATQDPNQLSETAVLKQLQKCFKEIESQHTKLITTIREVNSTLTSVSNLYEQLLCCQRVSVRTTPLAKFPDVADRIQHKIMAAMEDKLAALTSTV